ncbi:MAG: threonine synthase [Bryobacterales bacterium]|nr:threonine synthase [Bryobacterales bacterium]
MNYLTHLECSLCSRNFEPGRPWALCPCGGPLLARYDLSAVRRDWTPARLAASRPDMWRYAPLLPVPPDSIISLGEGLTPLRRVRSLPDHNLWVKDEGLNPTASFKARGLSCAISMARELGLRGVAIGSAGNAASALAAYAAAAGLAAHVFLPRDVPQSNFIDCRACGAEVTLVDGLIGDCARLAAARSAAEGWFDLGTLKEPYRVEGKKTMGFEVAEQFNWELPDAILYPTGGGVGLIGMWKAFQELEAIGWIGPRRPRMIAVQAEGCKPVVRAWENGADRSEFWSDARTLASGLRVPKPLGDFLILGAIRASGGTALAVSDREMLDAGLRLAREEGIFAAPEGAACLAAAEKLLASGFLSPADRIVLFNTGSGLKYLEAYATRFPRRLSAEQDKLGGLITPR